MEKNKEFKIKGLSHQGHGVSKSEEAGIATFIPFTLPEEVIVASISKVKKNYQIANLEKVIESSEYRVDPKCGYFKSCGGCNLQHIEIKKQREYKLNSLKETLKRQFKITPKNGFQLLGEDLPAYNYRIRVKLFLSKDRKIGFHKLNSKEILEINSCEVVVEEIREVIKKLSTYKFPRSIRNIFIEKVNNDILIFLKGAGDKALRSIRANFKDLNFVKNEIVSSFSQVNNEANEILKEKVMDLVNSESITELYAGSGNFTFTLAEKGISIKAVEMDELLVNEANQKKADLKFEKTVSFYNQKAFDYVKNNKLAKTLLLDPPRTGALDVVEKIEPKHTKEIIYVSCNPATFGRDAKVLIEKGFSLERVYALDMFSQTSHLECVGYFKI